MKLNLVTLLILLLAYQLCYSQSNKVPGNIKEAIKILQSDCPDSLKAIIKKTDDNKILELSYPWGGQYKTIFNWIAEENKGVKINKYLIDKGISYNPHQETVILIAFRATLLNKPIDENATLKPYQNIELKWAKEDKVRFTTDSLRGFYIPKDIDDCLKKINKILSDSAKNEVKMWSEDEFITNAHFGFGRWVRNNWQLWSGSRLTAYFNKLGIYQAESMSGIILISYHRYLHNKDIKLEEQVIEDKKYWAKSKMEDSLEKVKAFKEYHIGDTVTYRHRFGFASDEQEKKSDKDICTAKGVVLEKEDSKLQLKIKIIETCDSRGIITFDSKDSHAFDKKSKKWTKFKKHIIEKAYKNDIKWFNYDLWESKD